MLLRIKLATLLATVATLASALPGHAQPAAKAEQTSFTRDGLSFPAIVTSPGTPGRHPAVVLISGSGATEADNMLPEAQAFARAGIVALTYRKRTEGYSKVHRDYTQLADDALAGMTQLLKNRPDVDPARIGLLGFSEGGWVAPLAATRSDAVKFLITVGANGLTPARQETWAVANRVRWHGIQGSMGHLLHTAMRQVTEGGVFPEPFYDPVPTLAKVTVPVLAVWGGYDVLTPPGESLEVYRDTFARTGHRHHTLKTYPDGQHRILGTDDRGFTKRADYQPGYLNLLGEWVNTVAFGPPVSTVDAAAKQDARTLPREPLGWWEAGWLQLAVLALLLIAFLGYGIGALRRTRSVRPARWLAGLGSAAVLGALGYLGFLFTSNAFHVGGPIILGRPLPWLAVQLLWVATVVAGVLTALAWRREKANVTARFRLPLLLAGTAVLVPFGLYWGLLLP
ncbi:dienelactone hydrolase family protein [Crossiella sp. CA198]|uniref:alpha/beta hydrolase family protein n=1 Tax=Crossiella sp. CA198 TaxID=3455607 RepID=UPI003F8D4A9E